MVGPGFGAFNGVSKLMSRTESRPTNINHRAKGKRTDSGLNPGSFAAYLADAPKSASFKEVAQAYRDGVDPADLPDILGGDS
jgi:hypothetical protein